MPIPVITSRQHALVAEMRAVARGDDPRLLLDGWHLVGEALAAAVAVDVLAYVTPLDPTGRGIVDRLRARGTRVVEVAARVLDAMSPVRAPTGVVAVATRPRWAADALIEPAPALVVVAAGLQDPGNVGAVIRSAEAGGATGVLLDTSSADPWGWKALRASMGSALRLPLRREPSVTPLVAAWRARGVRVVATDAHGGADLYASDLSGPCAVLLGAEGSGVPTALRALADECLHIPMRPPVESLNAAVAAALVVFEARRRRQGGR